VEDIPFYFLDFVFLDFPAVFIAMATACFWGWPAWTSSRMFFETIFEERPFFSGIESPNKLNGSGY
jgi:hypothetical protein